MDRRGAGGRPRADPCDETDLHRPEEHCRELIRIVDGFEPTPELRAWALRAMDVEAVREWRDLLAEAMRWQAERTGTPPPKRKRGRPQEMLARDLARGCARAWMQLRHQFPPKSKTGVEMLRSRLYYDMVRHAFGLAGLPGWHNHAYEAALRVSREIEAQRPTPGFAVMRITSMATPSGRRLSEDEMRETGFVVSDDELRAMGVFKTPPRPRKGRKPKKS